MRSFYRTGLVLISEDFEGNRETVFNGTYKELGDAIEFYHKQMEKAKRAYEKLSAEFWGLTYDSDTGELIHSFQLGVSE